jgi:hypothetical protein
MLCRQYGCIGVGNASVMVEQRQEQKKVMLLATVAIQPPLPPTAAKTQPLPQQ